MHYALIVENVYLYDLSAEYLELCISVSAYESLLCIFSGRYNERSCKWNWTKFSRQ